MDSKEIITDYPDEQFVFLMCESGIAGIGECAWVATAVLTHLRNTRDIVPSIVRHKGFDLASRCLVGLGFFRDYMQHLTDYRGYPSPEFFRGVGKATLVEEGEKGIAKNFEKWTEYFHEKFVVELNAKPEARKIGETGIIAPVVYEKTRYHSAYKSSGAWKGMGHLKRGYEFNDLRDRADAREN